MNQRINKKATNVQIKSLKGVQKVWGETFKDYLKLSQKLLELSYGWLKHWEILRFTYNPSASIRAHVAVDLQWLVLVSTQVDGVYA